MFHSTAFFRLPKLQVLLTRIRRQNEGLWQSYEVYVVSSDIEALRHCCIINYRRNASK